MLSNWDEALMVREMFGRTRCKNWTPLATQQLRLRHLVRIIGYNVSLDPSIGKGLYYTLHLATMCAPFYTSEVINSEDPKWKELEFNDENGHNSGVVIRIWLKGDSISDRMVCVWGVYFSGLVYLGNKIQEILPKYFENNTIIFKFIGGYFTSHKCLKKQSGPEESVLISSSNSVTPVTPDPSHTKLPFAHNVNLIMVSNETDPLSSDEKVYRNSNLMVSKMDVKSSYDVQKLQELHSLQRLIKNEVAKNNILRGKICQKCPMFDTNPNKEIEKKPPKQNTSMLGLSSLNKILNEQSQPSRYEREEAWKLKKLIEGAKFNCKLLSQEKDRKTAYLRQLTQNLVKLSDENDYASSLLMDRYRQLSRDFEKNREWRKSFVDTRETYVHSSVYLNLQRKQLMSELLDIYPIEQIGEKAFTICGVYLPESESLADTDDAALSVALGYAAHVIQMCSIFLNVPLRYPILHYGSRSKIYDYITDKIPDTDREFPLYVRGKDQRYFQYAVYLLNKNIAQLRWYCGLPTHDLRSTLRNLVTFLQFRNNFTPNAGSTPKRNTAPDHLAKTLENLQISDYALSKNVKSQLSTSQKTSRSLLGLQLATSQTQLTTKHKSCDNFLSSPHKNGFDRPSRHHHQTNSQLLLRSHCVDCNIEQGLDLLDPRASLLLCNNEHSTEPMNLPKPSSKQRVTRSMGDYEEDYPRQFNNSPNSEPLLNKQVILPESLQEERRTEFLQEWLNNGPALVCSEEHLYPEEFLGTTISRDFESDREDDIVSRDSSDRFMAQ